MAETVKLEVVEVKETAEALEIGLATPDYSETYDLKLYKQQYDKETETWSEDAEVTERFEKALEAIKGYDEEDATLDLYVSEESGKAFINPPKEFLRAEKPAKKFAGKLWMNAVIIAIEDTPKAREVFVEYKGVIYSFSFNTSKWIDNKKHKGFVLNKAMQAKAKARFNKLFEDVIETGAWEDLDTLLGLKINCKVNENKLDPKSDKGWLEPIAPDGIEYDDAKREEIMLKKMNDAEVPADEKPEDLPF